MVLASFNLYGLKGNYSVRVSVCVKEMENKLKVYSSHNLKCRLLMLFIFMSSRIRIFDCFMRPFTR